MIQSHLINLTLLRTFITISISILLATSLCGQNLTYEVMRGGKSMGQSVVTRTIDGENIHYQLNTQTKFRVIFLIEVEYNLEERFIKGYLTSGSSFNTLNGSLQKETKLKQRESDYELIIDGIRTTISKASIANSVSEIYFEEPSHEKPVFSAYYGRHLTFKKEEDHKYSLTSPDGTNIYFYENGICTRVDITRDFASFSQVLQPELLERVRKGEIKANQHD